MTPDLSMMLDSLGYDPRWLAYGFLDAQRLEAQYASCTQSDDKDARRYRYASFRAFLRERNSLTDEELAQYVELAQADSDRLTGRAALADLLLWRYLSARHFHTLMRNERFWRPPLLTLAFRVAQDRQPLPWRDVNPPAGIDAIRAILNPKYPPTAVLEERMRAGAWSKGGFLGTNESLEAVIDVDRRALAQLGLTPKRVGSALAEVIFEVMDDCLRMWRSDPEQAHRRYSHFSKIYHPVSGVVSAIEFEPYYPRGTREVQICKVYEPEAQPHFAFDNLPTTDIGFLVDEKYQFFWIEWGGWQDCPWGCKCQEWSYLDFLILNRQSGEYVMGPGLITHLIRQHRFFEGKESPYRVDPLQLVRVLELRR